jgi:hypothetical protein
MISRNNHFEGFCVSESIYTDKVVNFLEQYSLRINEKTFVMLDNTSVHRNAKIRETRNLGEKQEHFLFYRPLTPLI